MVSEVCMLKRDFLLEDAGSREMGGRWRMMEDDETQPL